MNKAGRILATITPEEPWGIDRVTRLEHTAQSASDALQDVKVAIWTAKTRAELVFLKALADKLSEDCNQLARLALKCDEKFDDWRMR